MKRLLFVLTFMSLTFPVIWGQTKIQKYAGTAMPYPNRTDSSITFRDGMTPFYINHLGRHGARFPTSRKALDKVEKVLVSAQQENGLTSEGMALLSMIRRLSRLFDGQWGKLSKLGETEQEGIAGRMIRNYPQLFSNSAKIEAIATYVPRSINSMDAFLSCMIRHNPALQVQRSEGKQYNHILRFFDLNKSYVNYKEKGDWLPIYKAFVHKKISPVPIMKKFLLNPEQYPDKEAEEFVMALFSVAAILPDTSIPLNLEDLFTLDEWHRYWQTQNLRQYMSKSSAPVGKMLPVAIAWPLLSEFIRSAQEVISGKSDYQANFRFAHAETVIPFVSLMGIEKTDVQVCQPDSVSVYWKDYEISPMAANVQWLFYRDRDQRIWVKILLNEEAVALPISTSCFPYYSWEKTRIFFNQRIEMAKKTLSVFNE